MTLSTAVRLKLGLPTAASIQLQDLIKSLRGVRQVGETGRGVGRHKVAAELHPFRGGQVVFVEDAISVAGDGVDGEQDLAIEIDEGMDGRGRVGGADAW